MWQAVIALIARAAKAFLPGLRPGRGQPGVAACAPGRVPSFRFQAGFDHGDQHLVWRFNDLSEFERDLEAKVGVGMLTIPDAEHLLIAARAEELRARKEAGCGR